MTIKDEIALRVEIAKRIWHLTGIYPMIQNYNHIIEESLMVGMTWIYRSDTGESLLVERQDNE